MRIVLKIAICSALWFCFACEQEQNMPIEGDFSITMVDDNYNVPVQARIINKITGADAFQWEFPNVLLKNHLQFILSYQLCSALPKREVI